MKNILIGVGVVVVVGGATYALVPRTVLKSFFQTGDKPTEQQFGDTIDSELNLQDDKKYLGAKEYEPSKEYATGDTAVKSETIYQAKVLTESQTQFKLDAVQPVTFRWTPLVPKPKEPVTYRLKVWQLMQGQNGTSAMKSNNPIVTKDVMDASEVTINGLYTGPCKPPYLCDFVWSVETMSSAHIETGSTGGTAPAATYEYEAGSAPQAR